MHFEDSPKRHAIICVIFFFCFLLIFSISGCSKKTSESAKSIPKRNTSPKISKQAPASLKGGALTVLTSEQAAMAGAEDALKDSGSLNGDVPLPDALTESLVLSTPALTTDEFATFPHEAMLKLIADMTPPEQPITNTRELDRLLQEEEDLMAGVKMDLEQTEVLQPMAELREKIAKAYYILGNPTRAAEYLLGSVTVMPENADRWELLGDWISAEQSPNTLPFLQHAYAMVLKTDPTRRSAQIKLAGICVSAGDFESARGLLEIILDDNDYDPEWMHVGLLATSYAQTEKIQDGIAFFETLLVKHGYSQYMLALAILEHENGDSKAVNDYLAYIDSSEPETSPLKQYAVVLRNAFKEGK